MRNRIVAAALLLLSFLTAFSQTTNATLGGSVSDASRALIPGVTVTATNTQTGIVSTAVTNETGSYNFASLQSGNYKVSAELPGFQTQSYNDVTLGVSQQVRLNFTLQVGGQSQSVEVNVAADTLIATTSSSVGTVLPGVQSSRSSTRHPQRSRPCGHSVRNSGKQLRRRTPDSAQHDTRRHSCQRWAL